MPASDIAAAYLRFLPHSPQLRLDEELALGRRIAFGLIRMRWAVSHCKVVQEAVISIARQTLAGLLQPKNVVDWADPREVREHFSLMIQLSGQPMRLSRMIRRTPFHECYWQSFMEEIASAASQDAALRLRLYQALRGRRDAAEAAEALVRSNLRPAASYASRYLDRLVPKDVIAAARIGLVRAARNYEFRTGRRFLDHARRFIDQELADKSMVI